MRAKQCGAARYLFCFSAVFISSHSIIIFIIYFIKAPIDFCLTSNTNNSQLYAYTDGKLREIETSESHSPHKFSSSEAKRRIVPTFAMEILQDY